jgi:hypothetical protein
MSGVRKRIDNHKSTPSSNLETDHLLSTETNRTRLERGLDEALPPEKRYSVCSYSIEEEQDHCKCRYDDFKAFD